MILLDDGRPLAVVPLDRVGKPIVDTRVDIELACPSADERALDLGDEAPDQALSAVRGIDEHIEEGDAALGPG